MLGDRVNINGKDYIIVSQLGDEVWLFDEEVAKTRIASDNMFLVINIKDSEVIMEKQLVQLIEDMIYKQMEDDTRPEAYNNVETKVLEAFYEACNNVTRVAEEDELECLEH